MNCGRNIMQNKHYVPFVTEYPEKEPDNNDWISMRLLKLYRLIKVSESVRDRKVRETDKKKVWYIIQRYEDTKRISKKTLEYANKLYRRYNDN